MARSTVFLCASIVLVSLIRCSRQSTTGATTVSATPSASPTPTSAPTTSGILSSPSPSPTETPPEKKFKARISVEESYKSSYKNLSSNESVNFINDFERKMGNFFSSELSEFKGVKVTMLLNGSVVVEFDIVVGKSSNASVGNIEAALKEGNSTGILEYTLIGEIDIKEVQESSTAVVPTRTLETAPTTSGILSSPSPSPTVSVSPTSAPITTATPTSSTKGTEIWDKAIDLATPLGTFIIVIVAVALVFILLIALICICCKYRTLKKRTRFPDHMTINDSEWIRSNDDLLMWERNLRASEVKTNNGVSNRPFNEKRA